MAIPFDEVLARMTADQRARVEARSAELIAREHGLREIRESLGLSQGWVAESLGVEQAAVSKLERRADVYVSSLRRYLRAMGAELEIVARFPGKPPVRVTQFDGPVIGPSKRGRRKKTPSPPGQG